jgi:hypothetical protein
VSILISELVLASEPLRGSIADTGRLFTARGSRKSPPACQLEIRSLLARVALVADRGADCIAHAPQRKP